MHLNPLRSATPAAQSRRRARSALAACAARTAGFTMVELLITISLLSILLALAAPSFGVWIRNAQVRSAAEALQNGIRLAQAESVRRNRQVRFFLTNGEPAGDATPVANGRNWSIALIDTAASVDDRFVQGGALSDSAAGVTLEGPAEMCFNSMGRRVPVATGGVDCTVTEALQVYTVNRTGASRPLKVTVALGGQVRLCDPGRLLADATPDGCPA